jgi:hypothetical protein
MYQAIRRGAISRALGKRPASISRYNVVREKGTSAKTWRSDSMGLISSSRSVLLVSIASVTLSPMTRSLMRQADLHRLTR